MNASTSSKLFVPVSQDILGHPKIMMAANILNCSELVIHGLLQVMWTWTLRYAPDGIVDILFTEGIGRRVFDLGPLGIKVDHVKDAFLEVGLLEETEDGHLYVHDWMEHGAGAHLQELAEQRAKNRERVARSRQRKKQSGTPDEQNQSGKKVDGEEDTGNAQLRNGNVTVTSQLRNDYSNDDVTVTSQLRNGNVTPKNKREREIKNNTPLSP